MLFRSQTDGVVGDYLLSADARYSEILDRDRVARLVASQGAGADPRNGRLVLAILMLEIWLSSFLPRAVRDVEPVRDRIALAS